MHIGYVKIVLMRHLIKEYGCKLPDGKSLEDVNRGAPNSGVTKIRFVLPPGSAAAGGIEQVQCLDLFSKAHLDGKEGLKDGVPYERDLVIQKMKEIYAKAKQKEKAKSSAPSLGP